MNIKIKSSLFYMLLNIINPQILKLSLLSFKNMSEGWIKLYRKSLDHWLYKKNKPLTRREAWENILLLVNYTPEKVLLGNQLIPCERGQSLKSLDTWAKQFNWNKSSVRRFFILLEKDSMIVTESLGQTTRLTVCQYEDYQDNRNADETQMKRKRNADETEMTPNKKEKKEKKEKNNNIIYPNVQEIEEYGREKGVIIDGDAIINYYTQNGTLDYWQRKDGKKVLGWKATLTKNWFKHAEKITSKTISIDSPYNFH